MRIVWYNYFWFMLTLFIIGFAAAKAFPADKASASIDLVFVVRDPRPLWQQPKNTDITVTHKWLNSHAKQVIVVAK